MGKIFYLIGKSCAGKDSLYNIIIRDETLGLNPVIRYTTRPIRDGETDGESYHFVDIEGYKDFKRSGKIIEEQVYHTVHGDWYYFTADDGTLDIDNKNYLAIGVLESFAGTRPSIVQPFVVDIGVKASTHSSPCELFMDIEPVEEVILSKSFFAVSLSDEL